MLERESNAFAKMAYVGLAFLGVWIFLTSLNIFALYSEENARNCGDLGWYGVRTQAYWGTSAVALLAIVLTVAYLYKDEDSEEKDSLRNRKGKGTV
jgi:hypothetical protein